jgi:tyrosine-protein kinase Etk/Wzc
MLYAATYEENQIEQKNEITEKTIQFIENQLKELSTTLSDAETELENFKKRSHSSIDIKDEAKEYYNRLNDVDYESELLKLELKNLDHVIRQLEQSTDFSIIAPSFADIKDPLFLQLLNELRTLDLQRKQLAFNTKENFPTLSQLNKNIENTRKALINNILNLKKNLNAKLAGLNDRLMRMETKLSFVPEKEREFINLKRRYTIRESLFNYLLEKRAELGISKAANVAENKVIEQPYSIGSIFPNRTKNKNITLLFCFLIPSLIIYIKRILNNKIISKSQLESLTKTPILGFIGHNKYQTNLAVYEKPNSLIAEAFRNIRTNIDYLSASKENKIILVSSTVSFEGKTFIGINLASVLAMSEKKVILLGMDLRKPKIYADFNITNDIGITNYLIGKSSLESIIQKTKLDNLDIIPAGPIPPNPAELIMDIKMEELINSLKVIYMTTLLLTPLQLV